MLGTWKLEKAARRELPNRKPILTDGYINIILSFVRFTTRRRLQFQTRRKRMVTATRMAATGNATIITITATPTTESRAMEIMPSAFVLLLVLVVIVIVIPSTHTHDLRRFRRFFLNRFCLFFVCL